MFTLQEQSAWNGLDKTNYIPTVLSYNWQHYSLFFGKFGFLLCLTEILCWTLFTTAWNGLDKTNHLQFGPVHLFFASSAKCMAINCYIVDIPLGWPQWWSFEDKGSTVDFLFPEFFELTFFELLISLQKVTKFWRLSKSIFNVRSDLNI